MDEQVCQEMTKRAAENVDWASYFLLVQACQKIVESAPGSIEACNEVNVQKALTEALERLGVAITEVMPLSEFWYYLPEGARK